MGHTPDKGSANQRELLYFSRSKNKIGNHVHFEQIHERTESIYLFGGELALRVIKRCNSANFSNTTAKRICYRLTKLSRKWLLTNYNYKFLNKKISNK